MPYLPTTTSRKTPISLLRPLLGSPNISPADEILAAESLYGNPEGENQLNAAEGNNQSDNDYDIVVKQTYYERGEEELDYDDDPHVEEDMVNRDDDDNPDDEDEGSNADDEEDDDLAEDLYAAESVRPKQGKDATIWGQLGTPVGERSTTDTETGETAEMMKSVLIESPDGDQTAGKNKSRRSRGRR